MLENSIKRILEVIFDVRFTKTENESFKIFLTDVSLEEYRIIQLLILLP